MSGCAGFSLLIATMRSQKCLNKMKPMLNNHFSSPVVGIGNMAWLNDGATYRVQMAQFLKKMYFKNIHSVGHCQTLLQQHKPAACSSQIRVWPMFQFVCMDVSSQLMLVTWDTHSMETIPWPQLRKDSLENLKCNFIWFSHFIHSTVQSVLCKYFI